MLYVCARFVVKHLRGCGREVMIIEGEGEESVTGEGNAKD